MRRADFVLVGLLSLFACKSEEKPPGDDNGEQLPTKNDPNAKDASKDGAVLVPSDSGGGDTGAGDLDASGTD